MNHLPRLLVITDVPVTDTVAGSLQLYRLLGGYPPDRLCICEGSLGSWQPARSRLSGVRHVGFNSGSPRWRRSRFAGLQACILATQGRRFASRIERAIGDFVPEVILTVTHFFACFGAGALARVRGVSLHLIVHDDWLVLSKVPRGFAGWAKRNFGGLYRHAVRRWCISPGMEGFQRKCHGAEGDVLLPVGGEYDMSGAAQRPGSAVGDSMVFAFAGTVPNGGRAKLLLEFASVIAPMGHRLMLLVPGGLEGVRAQAAKVGCRPESTNVIDRGYVPPGQIIGLLRAEADALVATETFDARHHDFLAHSFPSKLADYCGAGLPVISWAPPDASVSRWAAENPDVAIAITSEDRGQIIQVAHRLGGDLDLRRRMGEAAIRAAKAQFDPVAARHRLYRAIADSAGGAIRR